MAVRHDIYEPEPKNADDPTMSQKEAENKEAKYWEEKAKSARAKREYEEEQTRTRLLTGQTEPPFKVSGSIDLGKFDYQKQQEELRGNMERIKQESDAQIAMLQKTNEDYREKVHDVQMRMQEQMWQVRFDSLQKMMTETQASRSRSEDKSISQQIRELEETASLLGYKRLDSTALAANTPAELQLEILKLNMDNTRADREFQRQMKQDERDWQMKLKQLEFDASSKNKELEQAKEKQNMMASLPETIGRAIGRGIADKGASDTISQQPARQPTKQYHLEVNVGESGETDCPHCHNKIYIAKEAEQAACASCGLKVPIRRTGAETATTAVGEDEF